MVFSFSYVFLRRPINLVSLIFIIGGLSQPIAYGSAEREVSCQALLAANILGQRLNSIGIEKADSDRLSQLGLVTVGDFLALSPNELKNLLQKARFNIEEIALIVRIIAKKMPSLMTAASYNLDRIINQSLTNFDSEKKLMGDPIPDSIPTPLRIRLNRAGYRTLDEIALRTVEEMHALDMGVNLLIQVERLLFLTGRHLADRAPIATIDLDEPIEALNLPTRIYRKLKDGGVMTVRELVYPHRRVSIRSNSARFFFGGPLISFSLQQIWTLQTVLVSFGYSLETKKFDLTKPLL